LTCTSEIPCDTTEYEISPTPETAVMNWYHSVGNWCFMWLMEDIQDLLDDRCKSFDEKQEDHILADNLIKKLKLRLSGEIITSERQKRIANSFFQAIGRGCPWGSKREYSSNSIDAILYGCACCGIKEFNDIGENRKKQQFNLLPLSQLNLLKLDKIETKKYKEQLNMMLMLPSNEEGILMAFCPWKVRSIYIHQDQRKQTCDFESFYYLHPELMVENKN
jgi:hypothetical protein